MGTRSTTKVIDEYGKTVVNMYRQYDGYFEGHGKELAEFLASKTVINGFGDQNMETHANGLGCLAAQLVGSFKKDIGGFYLVPHDQQEEYNYTIKVDDDRNIVMIGEGYDKKFEGSPKEFLDTMV
jgi:hypothetical protein